MKNFFAFLTLAVLVVACNSVEVQKQTWSHLEVGSVRPGDTVLQRRDVIVNGRPRVTKSRDIIYRGNNGTFISAIVAQQVGMNLYATARIVGGGVGSNYVIIRLQSFRGYGFYFDIVIWGSH